MPYRPWEEATPDSELPPQSTPTKSAGNDGASGADPYAADPYRLSDEEEGIGATKIRQVRKPDFPANLPHFPAKYQNFPQRRPAEAFIIPPRRL